MSKGPIDIPRFLPQGEMLRVFLEQPFITKGDLSELLRQRGIFINPNEKRETIPWLMCTLLSPIEFDRLRENQNTKEDNPKINTQTIPWASHATLMNGLPDNFNVNSVLDLEFSNFKVVGSPNFVQVGNNPNHVILEFEIERQDYSKSWVNNKNSFLGSLELEKIQNGNEVKLVITHTANETKYVATKAAQGVINHFKEKNHISQNSSINKILFDSFDNEKRINYFMSLTRDMKSSLLKFDDLIDFEFSPDSTNNLPAEMKWMEKRINDLKVNGEKLHNTFFIKEKNFHPYIHLYHLDCRYSFDHKGLQGSCVISAGFTEYGKSKETQSELEVNVRNISFQTSLKGITRSEVIKIILHEFDSLKIEAFKKIVSMHS